MAKINWYFAPDFIMLILMQQKKPVIAYFTRNIQNMVGNSLLKGCINKAQKEHINFICYHGGHLGRDKSALIYNLFDKKWVDGIITWASSKTDYDKSFYCRYPQTPMVTMTLPVPDLPVVKVDTYQGMKEVVEHFVVQHKYTKIAFIRGPENHVYAMARYQAYLDVLQHHGIIPDKKLITPPGTWEPAWGREAVDLLLNQRGLVPGKSLEGIIAVSDNVALEALRALQELGIDIPADIALAGYNGSVESRCSNPPLTTVTMPFEKQSSTAIDMIKTILSGEQTPGEINLPSRMVPGQSCGCQSKAVTKAAAHTTEISKHAPAPRPLQSRERLMKIFSGPNEKSVQQQQEENIKKSVSDAVDAVIKLSSDEKIPEVFYKKQTRDLLNAFYTETEEFIPGVFISKLSSILHNIVAREGKVEMWHSVISAIRRSFLGTCTDEKVIFLAEDLWQQARVLISETAARAMESIYLERNKTENILRTIGEELIATFDLKTLMDVLANSLPRLGIPSCYLSIYEEQEAAALGKKVPEWGKLILAYNEKGRIKLTEEGRRFPAGQLVPRDLVPTDREYIYIVEPLHFLDRQLGFVVFETGPHDGYIYLSLKNQLSNSLYGTMLLMENVKVKGLLSASMKKMHDKAAIVSFTSLNISTHVQEISDSMETVAAGIREISLNITRVMESVTRTVDIAGGVKEEITDLAGHSQVIGEIVEIINDIADRTKILSLNAAIEAARSGVAGKGFAVVAREMKNLTRKTIDSTVKIGEMIEKTQLNTTRTAGAINQLVTIVNQVSELSNTITAAITQQAEAASEISSLINEAAKGSKNISRAISEVASMGENKDEMEDPAG